MPVQYLMRLPLLIGAVLKQFDSMYKHQVNNKVEYLATRVIIHRSLKIIQSVSCLLNI